MLRLLIADTFSDSLSRITDEEQKVVKTTAFDLQFDPANPGMQSAVPIPRVTVPVRPAEGDPEETPGTQSVVGEHLDDRSLAPAAAPGIAGDQLVGWGQALVSLCTHPFWASSVVPPAH